MQANNRERKFLTEGQVNTLMSGAKTATRGNRGKYVSAGYTAQTLYIADVPAGSAQDSLRDYNRAGYRSERPWRETPTPIFEGEAVQAVSVPPARRKKSSRPRGPVEYLLREAARDRAGVAACFLLAAAMLMLTAAWGQKMVAGVESQRAIAGYQSQTIAFEQENERLTQKLELAQNGERIRNLAQNELGMLRPERARTETIYIQAPEVPTQETVQNSSQTRMEPLDFFLGLLSVFHIGE